MKQLDKGVVLLLFFILVAPAQAWDWDTHQWLAERVCEDLACPCLDTIKEGSLVPDRDFKDFRNHHHYDPKTCKPSPYYKCPTRYDDVALDKTRYWLERAGDAEGCERWEYIGIASHYFFDSKDIWHQVQDEDYYGCHKPFEDAVGEKFAAGETNWSVCRCGACVSYGDFLKWVGEFEGMVEEYLMVPAETTAETASVTEIPTTQPLTVETTPEISPPEKVGTLGFEITISVVGLSIAIAVRKWV